MAVMAHCMPLRLVTNPLGPQFRRPPATTSLRTDQVFRPQEVLDDRFRGEVKDLGVEISAVIISQRRGGYLLGRRNHAARW
jgi:hypothetical protein